MKGPARNDTSSRVRVKIRIRYMVGWSAVGDKNAGSQAKLSYTRCTVNAARNYTGHPLCVCVRQERSRPVRQFDRRVAVLDF